MTKVSELTPLVRKLAAAFVHAQVSGETIAVYAEFLADIPVNELRVVIDQVIMEEKFFPSVATIRARWQKMIEPEIDTAMNQWGRVMRAISAEGRVWSPSFRDPITQSIVNAIGWENLCLSENQASDRARFIEAYNERVKRVEQRRLETRAARQLSDTYRNGPKLLEQGESRGDQNTRAAN